MARLPLNRLAWQMRFVVAGVAVAQSINDGRPATGAVVALILVMTYSDPWCQRAWGRGLLDAGDRFVAAHGLGPHLAAYLRRFSATNVIVARIHFLADTPLTA